MRHDREPPEQPGQLGGGERFSGLAPLAPGRRFDFCQRSRKLDRWHPIHVLNLKDASNVGQQPDSYGFISSLGLAAQLYQSLPCGFRPSTLGQLRNRQQGLRAVLLAVCKRIGQ